MFTEHRLYARLSVSPPFCFCSNSWVIVEIGVLRPRKENWLVQILIGR